MGKYDKMAAAAQALTERTRAIFGDDFSETIDSTYSSISTSYKRKVEYESVRELPKALAEKQAKAAASRGPKRPKVQAGGNQMALVKSEGKPGQPPQTNEWFASGAGDRTIKIWDLATGQLRLTLTGHISTVRGLAVSPRHPYLFSRGEDKMVKCWDLETNKVIRHYHGHLSGVYTLALHPTLDVLVTGGRDGVARVWDMRTRSNIHVLAGHKGTVSDLKCQEADPQVITASLDSTVRLWDLAAGKTMGVLTHHKKGVRALAVHPKEFTFATGSTGSIKQWKCPEGAFMQNFDGQNSIINTMSVNEDNVLFSGGDNGSMSFWDWKTGHRFQALDTTAQPGSLDAEAGLMSSTFDKTGLRLICGEADKTIKVWKQDETATPETHPLEWKPTLGRQKF